MRSGAVFRNKESYGAVRCGFEKGENSTVRFGTVNRAEPHWTDEKNGTVKNPDMFERMDDFGLSAREINLNA